jgi:hypothetical protein
MVPARLTRTKECYRLREGRQLDWRALRSEEEQEAMLASVPLWHCLQTACHLRVSKKKFSCLEEVSAFDLIPHTFCTFLLCFCSSPNEVVPDFFHVSIMTYAAKACSCCPMSFPVWAFLLLTLGLVRYRCLAALLPPVKFGRRVGNHHVHGYLSFTRAVKQIQSFWWCVGWVNPQAYLAGIGKPWKKLNQVLSQV